MVNAVTTPTIQIKRVYDEPSERDGFRILVDRIWPRGLAKAAASIDLWLKDIAPSSILRTWFGHSPVRWTEFKRRYYAELAGAVQAAALAKLRAVKEPSITLLYAAKDQEHNNAVALRDYLAKAGLGQPR